MPETSGGGTAGSTASGTSDSSFVPSSLTSLIPTFDPATDQVEVWAQKVELLSKVWPSDKISELTTRLILNTKGSAFQKLQIRQKDLLKNDLACVKLLVEIVGGQFGQVPLEKRYEAMSRMTHTWPGLMLHGRNCFLKILQWQWLTYKLTWPCVVVS